MLVHYELNKAIYMVISNSDMIKEYNIGVYFNIPSNSKFPYIYISDSVFYIEKTKNSQFYRIEHYIEIFTKNNGDNSSIIIMDKIDSVLNIDNINKFRSKIKNIDLVQYQLKNNIESNISHIKSKFISTLTGSL